MARATPERLHAIVSTQANRYPALHDTFGLITRADPAPSGYDQTPEKALTFAWTGGDGVHFSLLDTDDRDVAPVIMTVPMHFDEPNIVVGRNLHDFLSLGIRTGYFALESLAYERATAIARLDARTFAPGLDRPVRLTLRALEKAFDLAPWTDHGARLDALATEFGPLLET